ncbi:MAG: 50S ribosomal protein L15 [Candidatus Methylumidiphilus sp.]
MYLNTLAPAENSKSKRKRVGRGIGSTLGKTCGRGHKGQHARSGGFHKTGFEGGQMPLQRRLPKVGFKSNLSPFKKQISLFAINRLDVEIIDLKVLKLHGIVPSTCRKAKIIDSGLVNKALHLRGIQTSDGARKKIISFGGQVEV